MLEFFGGLAMALGGSVPGVSGGTIAFLMGFFDDLIDSVNAFVSKGSEKKKPFFFLLRLGVGYLIGVILATLLVKAIFVEYIYEVSAAFIGVTLFSVPLVLWEERETLKKRLYDVWWILPGCALIVGMTLLAGLRGQGEASAWLQILLAFPAGIFVACAMIMPGISGAAIFYIFGLYSAVFMGIDGLMHLDFSALPMLLSLALGGVVGLFGVVKGVKWLLRNKRSQTIFAIVGMMLGSLYAIWVGPSTLDPPKNDLTFGEFKWLFFLLGGLFIGAFAALKIVFERKRAQKAAEKTGEGGEERKE